MYARVSANNITRKKKRKKKQNRGMVLCTSNKTQDSNVGEVMECSTHNHRDLVPQRFIDGCSVLFFFFFFFYLSLWWACMCVWVDVRCKFYGRHTTWIMHSMQTIKLSCINAFSLDLTGFFFRSCAMATAGFDHSWWPISPANLNVWYVWQRNIFGICIKLLGRSQMCWPDGRMC